MPRNEKIRVTQTKDDISSGYIDCRNIMIDGKYVLKDSISDIRNDIEKLKEEVAGVKHRKTKHRRTSVKIRL